ncbi:MAG: hypothetical protein II916_05075 [Oscillospiraceae bacterium]|nr:hypothetical protein [Oscillospiraceae bacterium]
MEREPLCSAGVTTDSSALFSSGTAAFSATGSVAAHAEQLHIKSIVVKNAVILLNFIEGHLAVKVTISL